MIIGIVGFAGSGKDTLADRLCDKWNFKRFAFADSLKDAVSSIFGWPRHLLQGDTAESRSWREHQDDFWSEAFDKPITPRIILQIVGTEVMRNSLLDNIWIKSLQHKLMASTVDCVITDVRFPNEIDFLKSMNAKIIEVKRFEPAWVNEISSMHYSMIEAYMKADRATIHASEWQRFTIDQKKYIDHVISNTGTKEEFFQKIDEYCVDTL